LATTTRGWNRLFSGADAWPAFLLIRDLVDSLVNRDQGQHNLLVGQSTRLSIPRGPSESDNEQASETRVQMFPPEGIPVPLVAEGNLVTITQIDAPGHYWLRSSRQVTGLSANIAAQEIDLTRIDPIELEAWLGKEQFGVVRNRDEIRQAAGKGQPTRSLYPTMLLLLLGVFVLEQIIANRFYATKATAARTTTATAKAAIAS
jgi:hypothetical protein